MLLEKMGLKQTRNYTCSANFHRSFVRLRQQGDGLAGARRQETGMMEGDGRYDRC